MTTGLPPPGFETGRAATPADLKSLPSIGQQAVQALEGCIKSHHVAEIDYTDRIRSLRDTGEVFEPTW